MEEERDGNVCSLGYVEQEVKNSGPSCSPNENAPHNNTVEVEVEMQKEIKDSICCWEDCKEACNMKCGACQKVTYCSAKHQKKHWKEHRKYCCPYIAKEDEEFGSYLVAARDLKANVEIIHERPTVYAPVYREVSFNGPSNESPSTATDVSFCLTCCTHLSENSLCSKCGWPVCGITCENNIYHREYECEYLSKGKISYLEVLTDKNIHDVYKSIFVLRCLIFRERNPTVWKNVEKSYIAKEDFESTDSKEIPCNNVEVYMQLITCCGAENLVKEIPCNNIEIYMQLITCYGAENLVKDSDDLNCVMEFISYLSFGDTKSIPCENGTRVMSAIFIFEKLLMLVNNNCYPNANWGITFPPSFEIVIRSAVPIKKGTMISIPLNNEFDLYATHLRQLYRCKARRKLCSCPRCSDPTELQTNLSSVKCFECKKGYYTPMNPLCIQTDWRCCYCEDIVECSAIFDVIKSTETSIYEALDDGNIEELENIYNRLMRSTFHPNHFIVVNLSYHILQMHMQDIFGLNDFGLERVVAHCRNILAVADIVLPGLSMIRATILTFLTKAMCLQIPSLNSDSKPSTGPKKNALANRLTKLRQNLSDALEYYKNDPNTTLPTGENIFVEELEAINSQLFKTTNELEVRNSY